MSWKPLPHSSNYEINPQGEIRSVPRSYKVGDSTKSIKGKKLKVRKSGKTVVRTGPSHQILIHGPTVASEMQW